MNPNEINFFAKTNFRNKEVPFGIKTDDRRRHMYIIGKTGMGKTTVMENMAIQDIHNGHGVCFIDPHGDSVVKILDHIPSHRINDVIYFNPADLNHPIAFNILEAVDTKYKHLVASGLMGVFTKIWANMWSSRMEYILNNTILALLDSPGNTMLGIVRMYVDKKYRKNIIDNIKDPIVRSFWVDEFANYNDKYRTEAIAPIQNKVGQFLSSAVTRNILGQPKSTLDLRDVMDNQKILLMDLSKGKVGEDNSALLGAMIITKLQLAALSRVDIPESQRKDFYLYVDEFQNFVTDSFATILSEARKYRLNLTMGHQYIGQLTPENNTKVRDAVFGNVGTMVVFRVGAADAEYLETEFEPHFTPVDIVNQPKYHIILKLMINGVASDPFTAITTPVDPKYFTGNGEKVIKVSRERYANPVREVEEKIARWMGVDFDDQPAVAAQKAITDADMAKAALPAPEDDDGEEPEMFANIPQPFKDGLSDDIAEKDTVPLVPHMVPDAEPEKPTAPKPAITIAGELINRMQQPPAPKPQAPYQAAQGQSGFTRPKGPGMNRDGRDNRDARNPRENRDFRPTSSSPRDRGFDQSGNRYNDPQQGMKPKPKAQPKRDNPIWKAASEIQQNKVQSIADTVGEALGAAFTKPAPTEQAEKPSDKPVQEKNHSSSTKKVMKPGQVHKF